MKNTYLNNSLKKDIDGDFYYTVWEKENYTYSIIVDGYGLGITDGYITDRPIVYDDNTIGYDCPEILPKYIKREMTKIANYFGSDKLSRIDEAIFKTFNLI